MLFRRKAGCARSNCLTSDWFARQGQIISAIMYLFYSNDLMDSLDASEDCFKLNTFKYGCPTVADDMLLHSFTKNGLQRLMDLCYSNSIHNNYTYNHTKCKVIVYNESSNGYKNANREWNV